MKKTLLILMGVALTFALATTLAAAAGDMSKEPSNGVTCFGPGVVALDDAAILPIQPHVEATLYAEGSAAGGPRESVLTYNGATCFGPGVVALDDAAILPMQPHVEANLAEGSAAGGLREEKLPYNGATWFGPGSASLDDGAILPVR